MTLSVFAEIGIERRWSNDQKEQDIKTPRSKFRRITQELSDGMMPRETRKRDKNLIPGRNREKLSPEFSNQPMSPADRKSGKALLWGKKNVSTAPGNQSPSLADRRECSAPQEGRRKKSENFSDATLACVFPGTSRSDRQTISPCAMTGTSSRKVIKTHSDVELAVNMLSRAQSEDTSKLMSSCERMSSYEVAVDSFLRVKSEGLRNVRGNYQRVLSPGLAGDDSWHTVNEMGRDGATSGARLDCATLHELLTEGSPSPRRGMSGGKSLSESQFLFDEEEERIFDELTTPRLRYDTAACAHRSARDEGPRSNIDAMTSRSMTDAATPRSTSGAARRSSYTVSTPRSAGSSAMPGSACGTPRAIHHYDAERQASSMRSRGYTKSAELTPERLVPAKHLLLTSSDRSICETELHSSSTRSRGSANSLGDTQSCIPPVLDSSQLLQSASKRAPSHLDSLRRNMGNSRSFSSAQGCKTHLVCITNLSQSASTMSVQSVPTRSGSGCSMPPLQLASLESAKNVPSPAASWRLPAQRDCTDDLNSLQFTPFFPPTCDPPVEGASNFEEQAHTPPASWAPPNRRNLPGTPTEHQGISSSTEKLHMQPSSWGSPDRSTLAGNVESPPVLLRASAELSESAMSYRCGVGIGFKVSCPVLQHRPALKF